MTAIRKGSFWLVLIVVAAVINVGLFGIMGMLVRKHREPPAMEEVVGVSLVTLTPPEPPQKQEIRDPEPPPAREKPDFAPDLIQPSIGDLGTGGLSINMGTTDVGTRTDEKEFIFDSVDLDQAPQVLVQTPPEYPFKAREQGVEGYVAVKMLVREDGSVGQINVIKAKPQGFFENAVRRALPSWTYQPGRIGGDPVTSWVMTTVRFNLN
jgi:protein TonB